MAVEQTTSAECPQRRGRRRYVGPAIATAIAALFIAMLVYGLAARAPNTSIDDNLTKGRTPPAPPFNLAVLQRGQLGPVLGRRLAPAFADGNVSLRELRGTPVVLNFWASWCIPCREEAPLLERTWRRDARRRGVLFVGLDMQDGPDAARSFMRQYGVDYLNIRDPGNPVARGYGVTGVPETFFITPRGRIIGHVIGVTTAQQLRAGIDAARAGRLVGAEEGGEQRPVR